ncbi:hypothetical protein [Homoserinibacter gongjuensis]|uniref:hypothetical protein n=1 Tax=Homoserinibacter gongjuensis TaxID=1162968 RepID=UPI0024E11B3D|nr:hypothetical protein [Homoserinibacter gongjuensis]
MDHPLSPEFAQRSGGELATVTDGEVSLSWRLLGAADVRGSVATYRDGTQHPLWFRNVLPGVDLNYAVERSGVKESMVLAAPPETAPEYRWLLSAPGLTVESDEAGGYLVLDAEGSVRFTISPPVMWDAAGVEGAGARVHLGRVERHAPRRGLAADVAAGLCVADGCGSGVSGDDRPEHQSGSERDEVIQVGRGGAEQPDLVRQPVAG